jgi:hypothetical protein
MVYLLFAMLYIVVVPVGESPDEPAHIQYVEVLLRTGQLPTIPVDSERYTYEAVQPPLYYFIQSAWVRVLGLGDTLLPPLRPNPQFDVEPLYSPVAYIHDYTAREAVPALLMRVVSALMGLATLGLVWWAARLAFPDSQVAGIVAVGFMALVPGFIFSGARVNNDALSALLGAAILVPICALLGPRDSTRKDAAGSASENDMEGETQGGSTIAPVLAREDVKPLTMYLLMGSLGALVGMGLLTKRSFLVFIPVLFLVGAFCYRYRWSTRIKGVLLALAMCLVFGVWPFVYNYVLYGDPLATNVMKEVYKDLASPLADIPFFWLIPAYIGGLGDSLWGVFGLRNIQLPSIVYSFFYGIVGLGLIGLLYGSRVRELSPGEKRLCLVLLSIVLLTYAGVAQYNTQFWTVQGRILLPSFAALALLLGRGIHVVWQRVPERGHVRSSIAIITLCIMVLINVYALSVHVIPAYYR